MRWPKLGWLGLGLLLAGCPAGSVQGLAPVNGSLGIGTGTGAPIVNLGTPPPSPGTAPLWVGTEATFFNPGSNTGLYLARLGVNRVRFFANYLNGTLQQFVGSSFGQDLQGRPVQTAGAFAAAVADLRTNPKGAWPNPVRWSTIDANLSDPQKNQDAQLSDLVALGKDPQAPFGVVVNLYLSINQLDLTTATDSSVGSYWSKLWEYYKYIYSMADWCIDHGIVDLELENEPDIIFREAQNVPDYAQYKSMFLVSSLALRHLRSDKGSAANVIGPVVAGSQTYSAFSASLMADYTQGFANFNDAAAGNFNVYSYHRYDASGPQHAAIAALYGSTVALAAGKPLPLFVTEMNAHTAAIWEGLPTSSDSPAEVSRMASQLANLVGRVQGMILFAFGERPNPGSASGLNKNGIHPLAAAGSPYTVGSASRSAEAFALFARATAGAKSLFALAGQPGIPSDRPVVGSFDDQHVYVYAANDQGTPTALTVDLAAWGFDPTTPLLVSRVDSAFYGEVAQRSSLAAPFVLSLPANGVALLTVPRGISQTLLVQPTATTTLHAGGLSDTSGAPAPTLTVGTQATGGQEGTSVGVLSFSLDAGTAPRVRQAVLSLTVAAAVSAPRVLHVYAFAGVAAASGLTWTNSQLLSPLPSGKTVAGIVDNFVKYAASPAPLMLGSLGIAAGAANQTKCLEISRAVAAFPGGFTLLIVREMRRDGSADGSVPKDVLGDGAVSFASATAADPTQRPQLALYLTN
jgi:hypothetical protein